MQPSRTHVNHIPMGSWQTTMDDMHMARHVTCGKGNYKRSTTTQATQPHEAQALAAVHQRNTALHEKSMFHVRARLCRLHGGARVSPGIMPLIAGSYLQGSPTIIALSHAVTIHRRPRSLIDLHSSWALIDAKSRTLSQGAHRSWFL